MSQINGRISQIIGPVIDVYFDTKGENPLQEGFGESHPCRCHR